MNLNKGDLPVNNIKVLHYDAFSPYPNKGNPAGVVLDADHLSESDMQLIAHKVGFNETVFVVSSDVGDLRLKYFTPGHEINLCGHATMASLFALKTKGVLGEAGSVKIETNVGVLPIQFSMDNNNHLLIKMKQDHPEFIEFNGDRGKLAHAIGLHVDELEEDKPIVYGSTGAWTLLVPVKHIESFGRMKPINSLFPEILTQLPKASVHPFCLQTQDPHALMHARHFSSPFSGTVEDPVTGTASGVMGAYYLKYMYRNLDSIQFDVEQGQEIGRDGKVNVEVYRNESDTMDVFISGTAVFVEELDIWK
jgi:PhzF family phenazine biosynthesis protein